MFSSNQKFKISGDGIENLKQTIELLYKLSENDPEPEAYSISPRGILFYKYDTKGTPFIAPPSVETLT